MKPDKAAAVSRPVIQFKIDPRAQTSYLRFWFIADLLLASVVVAFWVAGLYWVARFTGLVSPLNPNRLKVVVGLGAVLLAGIGAFALRLWLRRIYGMAEVLFGLVVAWNAIRSGSQIGTMQMCIVLASAVYLVVRGLDNWLQGVEARHGTKGA